MRGAVETQWTDCGDAGEEQAGGSSGSVVEMLVRSRLEAVLALVVRCR